MVEKSIFDIFPNSSTDFQTKLDYAFEDSKGVQAQEEVKLNDGSTKKIIWHLGAWKNDVGDKIGVIITAEDITKIKELEYNLLKTKNLLEEKGKIAKIGTWEYEVENEKLTLSNVTKKIFKIKNNSKISVKNLIGFCGQKETEEIIKNSLYDAIENGKPWDISLPINLESESTVIVNTKGKPKFKNGKCKRIVGTVQIINDVALHAIKEEETLEKKHLSSYFLDAPVPLALLEFSTGDVLNINRELLKVIGSEKLELAIKENLETIQREILKETSFQISGKKETEINICLDITDLKGKKRVYNLKGKLANQETQLLCTFEDVTKSLSKVSNLEMRINKNEEEAEKLVNFTHMICHNLKGHAINYELMLDYLRNENDKKEKAKAIEVLKHSTGNLWANINDLREMVAIRRKIKTSKKRVKFNEVLGKVVQNLSGELKESKAKMLNEIPETQKIKGYPIFLENIMTNCISNAVKFRKPNKPLVVTISSEITKEYSIISIEDNGTGMDLKEKGEKLFQMGSSLGNNQDSRGMGLYIAKYQMDMMNGKIEVESVPNEGAIFKLYFPHI
jgi:signal transduction histidine kinase